MAADHNHGWPCITTEMLGWQQSSSLEHHQLDGPAMNRFERGARLAAVQSGSRPYWVVPSLSMFDMGDFLASASLHRSIWIYIVASDKSTIHSKKRSLQLVWVVYSSQLEHVFLASYIEGAELLSTAMGR